MAYPSKNCICNCNYNFPTTTFPVQCKSCSGPCNVNKKSGCSYSESEQKKIWGQVRVPASLYVMNISALNIAGDSRNLPKKEYADVNWNQYSDRAVPGIQTAYHPTRGNSLKATLTSDRPGAGAPAGKGVDVKHGSYARYLGRKKASNIRTQQENTAATKPIYGNKTLSYGIIENSADCCNK